MEEYDWTKAYQKNAQKRNYLDEFLGWVAYTSWWTWRLFVVSWEYFLFLELQHWQLLQQPPTPRSSHSKLIWDSLKNQSCWKLLQYRNISRLVVLALLNLYINEINYLFSLFAWRDLLTCVVQMEGLIKVENIIQVCWNCWRESTWSISFKESSMESLLKRPSFSTEQNTRCLTLKIFCSQSFQSAPTSWPSHGLQTTVEWGKLQPRKWWREEMR